MNKPDFIKEAKYMINNYCRTEACIEKAAKRLENLWEQGYRYAVVHDWSIAFDKSLAVQEQSLAQPSLEKQVRTKTTYHGTMCACAVCCGDAK